jgi:hypothetical protein
MLVSEFEQNIGQLVEDATFTQYTQANILTWLQDGIRVIAGIRPDAYAKVTTITLSTASATPGPFNIDSADLRLIQLTRNTLPLASLNRAIAGPVKKEEMDLVDPNWYAAPSVGYVKEYIWDEATPKVFYVYPQAPVSPAITVEAKVATVPTMPTGSTDTIPGNDTYLPALHEWAQYRLFSRDNEDTANFQKGLVHRDFFFALLGMKGQGDATIAPPRAEHTPAKVA